MVRPLVEYFGAGTKLGFLYILFGQNSMDCFENFATQSLCVSLGLSSSSTDLMAFLSFFLSTLDKIKNRNIQRAGL